MDRNSLGSNLSQLQVQVQQSASSPLSGGRSRTDSEAAAHDKTKQILRKVRETEQVIECIFKQAILSCKVKIGELYKEIYNINHK